MIHLHLGAHKTASTHLQKALAAACAGADGVCFLGPETLRAPGCLIEPLLAFGRDHPDGAQAAACLHERIADADHVLLSEENILGTAHSRQMLREKRFYPGAELRLERLVAALPRGPVTLHMAVRDPAGYLVSAYCQRLYSGHVLPFATFVAGVSLQDMLWSEVVRRLMSVAGVDRCVLWRYEDYQEILPQIAGALLPTRLSPRFLPEPGLVHPGLTVQAHDWLMAQHAAGRSPDGLAKEARARWPKTPGAMPFAPFDSARLARSARAYAADIAAVAILDRVTLLRPPVAKA